MTDTPISLLDAAEKLTGAELVPVTQEGESRKVRLQEMSDRMANIASTQNWAVPFRGALARLTSDNTGISWAILVPWQTTDYDTDGFWSVGNPSRFTIPAGVTKVRLIGSVALETGSGTGSIYCSITMNGSMAVCGVTAPRNNASGGYSNNDSFTVSPVLEVVPGDYFELRVNCNISDIDEILTDAQTFFAIEVVEVSDAEARPFEMSRFIGGTPTAATLIDQQVFSRIARLPENGGLSQFYADTAPSADTAFDLQKNGVSIGTLTFLSGENAGSLVSSEVDFDIGDRLSIVSPDPVNSIENISVNYRMVLR